MLEVKSFSNEIWENTINTANRQYDGNERQNGLNLKCIIFGATGVTKSKCKNNNCFQIKLFLPAIGHIVSPHTLPGPNTQCFDRKYFTIHWKKLYISASVEKLLSVVYCMLLWLELCLLQIWFEFCLCGKHLPNTGGHKASQPYRKNQLKTSIVWFLLFEAFWNSYIESSLCVRKLLHHHYIKILLLAMHAHHNKQGTFPDCDTL